MLRKLTGPHAIVFTPEAGSPCGPTKTVAGLFLLWIAVGDDPVEGRVRGDLHLGVVSQSTQPLLKLRVRPGGFPRLRAVPVWATLTIWKRAREERAR